MEYSKELISAIRKAQIDEELGVIIYAYMAKREKNQDNKKTLIQMSKDEKSHAMVWKNITKEDLKPNPFNIAFLKFLTVVAGFTFVVKIMQKSEHVAQEVYIEMEKQIPEASKLLADERRHETELYAMLDEERLHYVGAIVLGLNDALVELTGAIAGVTFALQDTKLVAMTGIVTGVSATLSMAASNYLAEKANGSKNPIKSSLYTGVAYLITVFFLVLPYLLLPNDSYALAFAIMIITVLLIIFVFNYYISVAKDQKFFSNFMQMAVISISVALIAFVIGVLAKNFLGIDVAWG